MFLVMRDATERNYQAKHIKMDAQNVVVLLQKKHTWVDQFTTVLYAKNK
jgi:hypothetical protein